MMRRKTDRLVVLCTVISFLCLIVVSVVSWTVLDTKSTTRQIQRERAANILRSCGEQNVRHDTTVDALNRVVLQRLSGQPVPAAVKPLEVKVRLAAALKLADPPVRSQVQQSVGSTTLLIEALAPHRDCRELVREQVNTD